MSPLAFYRDLLAKGVPEPVAYELAEKFEADRDAEVQARVTELLDRISTSIAGRDDAAVRRRAWDRERKAKARETKPVSGGIPVESGGTPVEAGGIPAELAAPRTCAGAQVVNPSLPSLRSEELGVGGGVVAPERVQPTDDWPAGKASDHAEQLIRAVNSPWLDPDKSPDLVTTRGRVAAWKRDGASWEHDVLPVVTGLCANRRSRVSSWKFFDAAISRSIGENRAALEIPEASRVVPFRNTGPPRTIDEKSSASWDYAIARIAADEQS